MIIMKNLRQRLGTGIVLAAAGIAGLIGIGGCESYNEYDLLSLASKGAVGESKTPEQAAFFSLSSDHFATQADRSDTRQVVGQNNNSKYEDFIVMKGSMNIIKGEIIRITPNTIDMRFQNGIEISFYQENIQGYYDE